MTGQSQTLKPVLKFRRNDGTALKLIYSHRRFLLDFFISFVARIFLGFSRFGTVMIFLPVAGQFLEPISAVTVLAVMDFFGPILLVPKAFI